MDDTWRLILLVAAGAVEGAALATGQYFAMEQHKPRRAVWVGATATAASVAWLIGILPSTISLTIDTVGAVVLLVAGLLMAVTVAALTAPQADTTNTAHRFPSLWQTPPAWQPALRLASTWYRRGYG